MTRLRAHIASVVVSPHEDRIYRTQRRYFRAIRGHAEERIRAAEIAALPTMQWKGHLLYSVRCCGDSGDGPHMINVPASRLWSVISLRHYRCRPHLDGPIAAPMRPTSRVAAALRLRKSFRTPGPWNGEAKARDQELRTLLTAMVPEEIDSYYAAVRRRERQGL